MRDIDLAASIISELCEFYHGMDYVEDALQIAQIVCCEGPEDNNAAEHLMQAIGYVLGIAWDWRVPPEIMAKVKAIRAIALPGIDDEAEVEADHVAIAR